VEHRRASAVVTLAAASLLTASVTTAHATVSGDGGDRIGTLRVSGAAYVKEGGLTKELVYQANNLTELALS
jgi:hypothetical protein